MKKKRFKNGCVAEVHDQYVYVRNAILALADSYHNEFPKDELFVFLGILNSCVVRTIVMSAPSKEEFEDLIKHTTHEGKWWGNAERESEGKLKIEFEQ